MIKNEMKGDQLFDIINYTILGVVMILTVYPLYFVVIASVSNPNAVNSGQVLFHPVGFSLEGYKAIFAEKSIWMGYKNTIIYTMFGTSLNVILTMMVAYPLSSKRFKGRRVLMIFLLITMYFNGGLIPTYLVVKGVGLLNKWAVMIILNAVVVFNVIIARSFLQSNIPEELAEAAEIDGCGPIRFFTTIVLPLSKAILAVLALYYGVAHWNEFMRALIYLRDKELYPLQLVLRDILIQNQVDFDFVDPDEATYAKEKLAELIKYGSIIVSSLPVLIIYPYLQKYFVQGVMIGSVKG